MAFRLHFILTSRSTDQSPFENHPGRYPGHYVGSFGYLRHLKKARISPGYFGYGLNKFGKDIAVERNRREIEKPVAVVQANNAAKRQKHFLP